MRHNIKVTNWSKINLFYVKMNKFDLFADIHNGMPLLRLRSVADIGLCKWGTLLSLWVIRSERRNNWYNTDFILWHLRAEVEETVQRQRSRMVDSYTSCIDVLRFVECVSPRLRYIENIRLKIRSLNAVTCCMLKYLVLFTYSWIERKGTTREQTRRNYFSLLTFPNFFHLKLIFDF